MMKRCIVVLMLLVTNGLFAQESHCSRTTSFGSVELCLPQVDGYQECYEKPSVKELADATEVPANTVLGFYLNNQTYERRDSLGLINFDDYFKIYGTLQLQDYKAEAKVLSEMQSVLSSNFIIKDWDLVEKEFDQLGFEGTINEPTIIKKYNLNEDSFTYILLVKYELEGVEPFTLVMSINGYLYKERLIWMAYYLNFDGEPSIDKLEKKSNEILLKIMNS